MSWLYTSGHKVGKLVSCIYLQPWGHTEVRQSAVAETTRREDPKEVFGTEPLGPGCPTLGLYANSYMHTYLHACMHACMHMHTYIGKYTHT